MKKLNTSSIAILALSIIIGLAGPIATLAAGQTPVNLKTSGNFVILAQSGITTTGNTKIIGNIGVSPIGSTAMTGFGLKLNRLNRF